MSDTIKCECIEESKGSHDSRKLSKMLKGKVLILSVTLAHLNGVEEEHN